MSLALLFPGQGVQHADMLPWLHAEPAAAAGLAAIAARLGSDWRDRVADDDWACGNRVAQTLIAGLSQAAWTVLAPRLPQPVAVAGYSVGELAAYCAAGVFDAEAGLDLAGLRAGAMDRCSAGAEQGMAAISGTGEAQVNALCQRFGVAVSIRISTQRFVIGGELQSLRAALDTLVGSQAEVSCLRVRLASHTPLMAAAADELLASIMPLPWHRSACLVVNNVDGEGRRDVEPLKAAFAGQVDRTLRWDLCMQTLAQRQPRCVLEVGPGTSLARMWASCYPDIPSRSISEFRSAAAIVNWVERQLAG